MVLSRLLRLHHWPVALKGLTCKQRMKNNNGSITVVIQKNLEAIIPYLQLDISYL